MTQRRDTVLAVPGCTMRRLLVVFTLAFALVGCSTEARYRIKTVIFTGVPPPQGESSTDEGATAEAQPTADAEQMARQQRHREATINRYWQHGPYAAGECGRCHSLVQSKSFLGNRDATSQGPASASPVSASSRLALPPSQLCVSCHTQHGADFARGSGLKQHLPAAAGACTTCHNPHQSLRRFMLLKADNRELCGGCHSSTTLTQIHDANAEQDCISCHNAHVGVTSKQLRSDAEELSLLYGGDLEVRR